MQERTGIVLQNLIPTFLEIFAWIKTKADCLLFGYLLWPKMTPPRGPCDIYMCLLLSSVSHCLQTSLDRHHYVRWHWLLLTSSKLSCPSGLVRSHRQTPRWALPYFLHRNDGHKGYHIRSTRCCAKGLPLTVPLHYADNSIRKLVASPFFRLRN